MSGILKLTLVILTVSFVLAGCGSAAKKQKPLRAEDVAITPNDQEKVKLRDKIDRRFEDSEAHFKLGKLYQTDGLWDKAEYEYNLALSFNPVHRRAQAAHVKVLQQTSSRKAELAAEIYINQAGGSADRSLRLGQAFQAEQLGQYGLACYRQALALAPNSAAIYKQLGYYYLAKGDKSKAEEYLKQSFQINPNQPEVAGQLGKLGVMIQIPKRPAKSNEKLEKIIESSEEK